MRESIKKKKILENPHCSMSNHLIPTAPSSCFQQTNTDKLAMRSRPPGKKTTFLIVNNVTCSRENA